MISAIRISALLEGISYLALLLIAMPLKYFGDLPAAVQVTGLAHGILFILACALLAIAFLRKTISFSLSLNVFIASLIPFGAFWADRKLATLQEEIANGT
ncbi:MAG: DUF3817 domain-containing protein [Verrucomicrobiota bacterium]